MFILLCLLAVHCYLHEATSGVCSTRLIPICALVYAGMLVGVGALSPEVCEPPSRLSPGSQTPRGPVSFSPLQPYNHTES